MSERFEVCESYGVKAALLQQVAAARASQSPATPLPTSPRHEQDASSSSTAERAFEEICSSALPISLDELRCHYFCAVQTLALFEGKLCTASATCLTTHGRVLTHNQTKQSDRGDL